MTTIIYISGIDGCGKTTQSKLLVDWLNSHGYQAEYQWLRWEPSVLPLLDSVRKLIGKGSNKAGSSKKVKEENENKAHGSWRGLKSSLMSSAVFRHFWLTYAVRDYFSAYKKRRGSWESDYIVMDRYVFDFVVDQSLNFGISPDDFLAMSRATPLENMQKPAYSVFIDIPAGVGYERKLDGTSLGYLKDREALYNSYRDGNNLHVDGQQSPEKIHQEIAHWLELNLVDQNV